MDADDAVAGARGCRDDRRAGAARRSPTVAPEPGARQARPDPRRRRRACATSAASPPSTSTSVEVQRGSITALIGPNGAGKTTFFNLMTGFDKPDAGDWSFDGHAMHGVAPHQTAARGMVRTFQLTKSLTKLPVIENMKLGATGSARRAVVERPDPGAVAARRSARSRHGPTRCSRASGSTTCATSTPARCRAASASCSRWRGR